ncbi:hypothetical protein GGS26DRAFT_215217 [Hypomontagnella submonticulosa]|nr:hypothetical protein GGS26DRAFT_215217 [Hypomontagnella submonticulosa]
MRSYHLGVHSVARPFPMGRSLAQEAAPGPDGGPSWIKSVPESKIGIPRIWTDPIQRRFVMGVPTQFSASIIRRSVVVVVLLLIYAFGANALYGLLYRNGYYHALLRLRDEGPHHLPGSSNPILTRYTYIGFLDKMLTLASVMFASVTDGNAPQLSLYAFHFGGQYLAILVVIAIEGLRIGNQFSPVRFFSVWGVLMQATSYGCTMPLYGMVHLLTSSTAEEAGPGFPESILTSNPFELSALPLALVIGYVIPAVLMSVPLFSNPVHQWFGGLWQGSPLFSMLLQKLLAIRLVNHYGARDVRNNRQKTAQPGLKETLLRNSQSQDTLAGEQEKGLLAKAYLFAFFWCIVSQIIPLVLIAAVRLRPSMFPTHLREAWTVYNVFMPPSFWSIKEMQSMARGMHDFFLYDQYVGSTAAIVWASALYVNSREASMKARNWTKLAFVVTALSVCSGPAGAVVWLMWERDQLLLSVRGKGI